ncbi:Membrane protein involved in the export of O-antigen and teichoic acid [Terribacillus halophilus]|uniref:Membrane protein involved in the export of O-antigen and teichoic acid n=1 Tax=Terribacillus halophilus TaxID=361279 RepID=A0A1G6IL69_9BACI|nr:oligosaccharide flippase family protein [Terribacillus halophilus]SDC07181.1 Membrane protein involved in the export of O-antigen and teichoic acid [Terribacillus halophilus]
MKSSLTQKLFNNISWNLLAAVLAQGSTFISTIIVARWLGSDEYGKYSLIYNTLVTVSGVAGMGLGITATKYVSKYKNTDKNIASGVLGLCANVAIVSAFTITIVILLSSEIIDRYALNMGNFSYLLLFAVLHIFFFILNGFQNGTLIGLEKFNVIGKINLVVGILTIIATPLLLTYFDLEGALLSLSLLAFIRWLLTSFSLRKYLLVSELEINRRAWKAHFPVFVKFALPAAISSMIGSFAIWISNVIVVKENIGFQELGYFSAAATLGTITLFLPKVINQVFSPMLSSVDRKNEKKMFIFNLITIIISSVIVMTIIFILTPTYINILGNDYRDIGAVIHVYQLSCLFQILATTFYQRVFVDGNMWIQLFINFVWAIVLISFTYLNANNGAVGLSYANLISWLVSTALYLIYYIKNTWRKNDVA